MQLQINRVKSNEAIIAQSKWESFVASYNVPMHLSHQKHNNVRQMFIWIGSADTFFNNPNKQKGFNQPRLRIEFERNKLWQEIWNSFWDDGLILLENLTPYHNNNQEEE